MMLKPIKCSWTEARPGDVLFVVEHYEELIGVLRRRAAALQFSYLEVDMASAKNNPVPFAPRRANQAREPKPRAAVA